MNKINSDFLICAFMTVIKVLMFYKLCAKNNYLRILKCTLLNILADKKLMEFNLLAEEFKVVNKLLSNEIINFEQIGIYH